MRYPVDFIAITQGYHTGKSLDFGWFSSEHHNQPIKAVADGTIYKTEKQPNGGNVIYLKHIDGVISCYAHLKEFMCKVGDKVKLGQTIALMGKSGNTTGEHLHFGLYSKGKNIYGNADLDPFKCLELYPEQILNEKTKKNYGSKIKKHENPIKYVYNVDWEGLVIHETAELISKQVGLLKPGSKVEVLGTIGNFTKIDEHKYVYSSYLTDKKPNVYEVTEDLNCRNGGSSKNDIVCVLKKGTVVQVFSTSLNGWAKVSPVSKRYVSKKFLKKI